MATALGARGRSANSVRVDFDVWSTTATLIVTDPDALELALAELNDELASFDATCSRFRDDSEISRVLAHPGRTATLSPLLNEAIGQAIRIATATDSLVDPTVAAAVIALGYDRDIGAVIVRSLVDSYPVARYQPAPGVHRIIHDRAAGHLLVPPGVGLDLGATAKALAADRAAARISRLTDGGVLVGLGGDIAVAGDAPEGGWRIAVADDHRAGSPVHQLVSIRSGGIATSSTMARRWRTASGWAHHIVDPRTGVNPESTWRTVCVAAASCLDANAAATAAIVLGSAAPDWLTRQQLPALLIDLDGDFIAVDGWPTTEPLSVPA
ncbi:MAG: FAD:protein FMN transferase [Nakamurella sp.]